MFLFEQKDIFFLFEQKKKITSLTRTDGINYLNDYFHVQYLPFFKTIHVEGNHSSCACQRLAEFMVENSTNLSSKTAKHFYQHLLSSPSP